QRTVVLTPGMESPHWIVERSASPAYPTTNRAGGTRHPTHEIHVPEIARTVVRSAVAFQAGRKPDGDESHGHNAMMTSRTRPVPILGSGVVRPLIGRLALQLPLTPALPETA